MDVAPALIPLPVSRKRPAETPLDKKKEEPIAQPPVPPAVADTKASVVPPPSTARRFAPVSHIF